MYKGNFFASMDYHASYMNNPARKSSTTRFARKKDHTPAPPQAELTCQRLIGAGTYLMTESNPKRPTSQKPWLLELYTQGRIEVNVEQAGWHPCGPGVGVLYPPGLRYMERVPPTGRGPGTCTSIALFFDLDRDAELLARLGRPLRHRFIDDTDGVLRRLGETIVQYHGNETPGSTLMAEGCFYQSLAALALAEDAGTTLIVRQSPPVSTDLVTTVHAFMRRHLERPMRLAEVAEYVGLSESGLSHAYRRLTGDSPMAALRRMRIEAARVYLLSNRLPLAQIARHTGFSDAFHLSRTFKQVTGMSPRTYRAAVARSFPDPNPNEPTKTTTATKHAETRTSP